MGEFATVSFAACLGRVGEESALGDVRVLAFVAPCARAVLGETEAEVLRIAFPTAFRCRTAVSRRLAWWACIAAGWAWLVAFIVTSTAVFGSSALEASGLGAKH